MNISISSIMSALARLKNIPLAKVIRNASRDYTQAAYTATPLAKISKSEWYVARRDGRKWYIHESQVSGKKIRNRKTGTRVSKVRIQKGWSKSTWIGAMKALGMSPKNRPARVRPEAEERSQAVQMTSNTNPKAVITDNFQIDQFGKASTQPQHERIAGEGFKLAARRMSAEFTRMMKEAWR